MNGLLDAARVTLAAARLTRAVVTDDVPGQWWIKDPIDRAMLRYHDRATTPVHPDTAPAFRAVMGNQYRTSFKEPWWWRYRSGLDCPHCVGFWIGAAMIAADGLLRHKPWWRALTWALALNAVIAPAGTAVGYWGDPDDED